MNNIGAGLMSHMTGVPAVVPLTFGQKFAMRQNKQITIVDTSSSLEDFTPQLLSLRRVYAGDESSICKYFLAPFSYKITIL